MEPIIVMDDVDTVILHFLDDESLYIMGNSNKYVKSYILKDKYLKPKYVNYRMKYTGLVKDMKRVKDALGLVEVQIVLNLSEKEVNMIIPYANNIIINDGNVSYKVHVDEVIKSIKSLLHYINHEFHINKLSQYSKRNFMVYKI